MRVMNGRLAGVENWQSRLQVVFRVASHLAPADERRQVQFESGIRK